MRGLALIVLAGMLSGCGTRDPYVSTRNVDVTGEWRIEKQTDRITGGNISSALLSTRNSSHTSEPYPHPAGLQLTCFETKPLVRISFDFKIGSDKNSILGYRFDEKPGHDNVESRVLIGYQTIVIEDKAAVAQFVGELATSSTLYLRIRSLNGGRTSAEFRLDGAPAAVQAAFADCPVSADQPRKRTS